MKAVTHEAAAYMPSTPWCSLSQNQMWDVLLLVSVPLKYWRELIPKVSIGVKQCIK